MTEATEEVEHDERKCAVCKKPLAPDEGAEVDDAFVLCNECEREVLDVPY